MLKNQAPKGVQTSPITPELIYFEDLFNEYYATLLAYSYKYVNDKQVAEDMVQDTFMALWIKKEELDFSTSIKPYLYTTVRNKSLSYLSTLPTTQSVEGEDIDYLIHKEISSYNQVDSLLLKEISDEIENYIETLPPQCKRIFKLSRGENKRNKEIAIQLGITEKAVEKQISKALFELRLHLQKMDLISFIYWMMAIRIFSNRL